MQILSVKNGWRFKAINDEHEFLHYVIIIPIIIVNKSFVFCLTYLHCIPYVQLRVRERILQVVFF